MCIQQFKERQIKFTCQVRLIGMLEFHRKKPQIPAVPRVVCFLTRRHVQLNDCLYFMTRDE